MSNELQVFNFTGNKSVRVIAGEPDGAPWWVAKDVANILGFRDAFNAIRLLDDDEKDTQKVSTLGGAQEMAVINESGLYALIFKSNKPEAKKFRKWVTSEVLPEIRRTGLYVANKTIAALQCEVKALEAGNIQLKQENAELQAQVSEMYPLKVLGEIVLAQKGSITVQEAAQLLSAHGFPIGQNRLYKLLRKLGIICRRKGKQWNNPTQKSVERGWLNLQIDHGFYVTPRVTPKGLQLFVNILTSQEFPLIDLIESLEK